MDCSANNLLNLARCFRCIPGGALKEVQLYLFCYWAQNQAPEERFNVDPDNAQFMWTDSGGVQTGNINDFYTITAVTGIGTVTALDFTTIPFNGNSITGMRFLTGLISVDLTNATVAGTVDASNCLSLIAFISDTATANLIDLSGSTALLNLNWAGPANINAVDLSGCTSLTDFRADFCGINTINLSNCSALHLLSLDQDRLTSIDLSVCPSIVHAIITVNLLTSVNLTNCTALHDLSLGGNGTLQTLDATPCTNLVDLSCAACGLLGANALKVTNLAALDTLDCNACVFLTGLDLTGCVSLRQVDCSNCDITGTLDVSPCFAVLDTVWCYANPNLDTLDLTGCATLIHLDGNACTISSIVGFPAANIIDYIDLSNNMLTQFDATNCTMITFLNASTNPLTDLRIGVAHTYLTLFAVDCSLPTSGIAPAEGVDQVLAHLAGNCLFNAGVVNLSGVTNGPPTNDCNPGSDCDNLINVGGWTVNTA